MTIYVFIIFAIIIILITTFSIVILMKGNLHLIHWLYFVNSSLTVVWLLALMFLWPFQGNLTAEYIIDAITNVAGFIPIIMLLIALTFVHNWDKLPFWGWLLFAVPMAEFILVWTNPVHHLHYQVFSIDRSAIQFGPSFYINGAYTYACFVISIAIIIYYAFVVKSSFALWQAILFIAGNLFTVVVSVLATSGIFPLKIYSTPLSYVFGIVLMHGIAIFRFHILDIKPLALETALSHISDGYLVVNDEGGVVNHNQAFSDTFGKVYDLVIDKKISDCLLNENLNVDKMAIHTLLSSMDTCRNSDTTISYEQALTIVVNGAANTQFFLVDVTGLKIANKNVGFVIFFKDISKLKESMRDLQNSQKRLMENDRLAFLGQIMGGISHNLKTPIMSISGSVNAINKLIDEAIVSLNDPEVTKADYLDICSEAKQWLPKIQEACTYMSDIIMAVKGQALNFNACYDMEFTINDVVRRVTLLLRHELQVHNCRLKLINNLTEENMKIYGDINSMVQVVNNLVSNAIDAMRDTGGDIELEANKDNENFFIKIKDRGPGPSADIKKKLFKQMVTSKGAMGSGLGLFMSNAFMKARFDGSMWFEDNPGGGAIFGISIPLKNIAVRTMDHKNRMFL